MLINTEDVIAKEGWASMFLIACSAKNHKYCVAGIVPIFEYATGKLKSSEIVRLVTDDEETDGAITPELITKDGEVASVLDYVEIYITASPTQLQPENQFISQREGQPQALLRLTKLSDLKNNDDCYILGNSIKHCLSRSGDILYNNQEYVEHSVVAEKMKSKDYHSLELRYLTNVTLHVVGNSFGQPKTKAKFVYHGKEYKHISVTDPNYFHISMHEPTIIDQCLALFSIGKCIDVHGNLRHYKFLASIIPFTKPIDEFE